MKVVPVIGDGVSIARWFFVVSPVIGLTALVLQKNVGKTRWATDGL